MQLTMLHMHSYSIKSYTKSTVYPRHKHVLAHGDNNHYIIVKVGHSFELKQMHSQTKEKYIQISLR